ncbi:MAG: hypothetical protein ACJARD_000611, partial [Alphaproteobacteria bacterium]
MTNDEAEKLNLIFFPSVVKKINYIKTYNLDFAHYTNAKAALS